MTRNQHPAWEEELMPYVDGQLGPEQASSIADHLKACEECTAMVADAARLSQQMQAWKVEESPAGMGARVLGEMRQAQKANRSWARRHIWTLSLAGATAAAILVAFLPSMLRSREPVSELTAALVHPTESSEAAGSLGRLYELEQSWSSAQEKTPSGSKVVPSDVQGPMIIRTAQLTVLTKDFDSARPKIEALARQLQGYLGNLVVRGETGSVRTLSASLRLPSNNLDAGMVELRKLGKVREESQNSSDVTSQYVDLQARLSNARNTEQRLVALQRQRTDKLADVVNVEREISRVREEIERMVAQQKEMTNQVQYATVQLSLTEEYRAEVQPVAPSPGSQLRNASIDGYRGALDSLLAVALFVLRYAPTLLLWSAVLAPVVLLARRYFHSIRLS